MLRLLRLCLFAFGILRNAFDCQRFVRCPYCGWGLSARVGPPLVLIGKKTLENCNKFPFFLLANTEPRIAVWCRAKPRHLNILRDHPLLPLTTHTAEDHRFVLIEAKIPEYYKGSSSSASCCHTATYRLRRRRSIVNGLDRNSYQSSNFFVHDCTPSSMEEQVSHWLSHSNCSGWGA